ncbi:surfeit locus protein 1-like protein, partial [Leptotrombidium deliense]
CYIVFKALPSTAFGLGTWQVQRRQWKLGLIEELEKCMTEAPVDFPENLNDIQNLVYRKVKVTGKFDHSNEVYIGPRNNLRSEEKSRGGGIISSARTAVNGFFVVTPFTLSGSNIKILVNRGWVPRYKIDPEKRQKGQIEDEVTITAVVRDTEKRPPFGISNDLSRRQFNYRDIMQMASILGTKPIFVDADSSSTVPGGPIGGQTVVSLRNEHAQYIFTWYGLGVLTMYLWYKKHFQTLKNFWRLR